MRFTNRIAGRHSNKKGARPVKVNLHLETLEDRTVLTRVSFSNLAPVPAPNAEAASSTDYDSSTVLVRFRAEAAAGAGSAILAGAQLREEIGIVPGLHVVDLPAGVSVPEALATYNASPAVWYAEPNFHVYAQDTIPNDPQWNNSGLYGLRKIQAPAAWDVWTGGGAGTIVASIDTGVTYTHPDLADNMWVNPSDGSHGYNFINHTNNPLDDNGHGSHTSGTMGAVGNNGVGIVGVNWNTQIMALKFLNSGGSGNIADALSALNFAVNNGALVSNNSWGCQGCFSFSFVSALQNAAANGHIFVAAAGNNGTNNDSTAFYPANYDQSVDNVISVAATDSSDRRASFSNYGANSVHLGAPGVNVYSTLRGSSYGVESGTSMASPHVAGAVTLVYDYYNAIMPGQFAYQDVINQIVYTVDPVPSLASTTISGGRLNVARAIGAITAPGAPGTHYDKAPLTIRLAQFRAAQLLGVTKITPAAGLARATLTSGQVVARSPAAIPLDNSIWAVSSVQSADQGTGRVLSVAPPQVDDLFAQDPTGIAF